MPIYCDSTISPRDGGSGYRMIHLSGQTSYRMWVNNVDNGGGWILAAVVRTAQDRAHNDTGAVNFNTATVNGMTVGVEKFASATSKATDAWMNAYRAQSNYAGSTAYWMQALSWSGGSSYDDRRNQFISSAATIASTTAASSQNARTILSLTFEGTLSDRNPNTGTIGLGDHHTSGTTGYFAWVRHPESSNPGFRQDIFGQSDGYLWIK